MRKWLFFVLLLTSTSLSAADWMRRLPSNIYVAQMSIPGAHDACTGSGWASGTSLIGNRYARTQDLHISELWSAGVRAFDLRPCVYKDYMNINHGIMPTVMHFEDVLHLLCDSLSQHPSEFAVIHLLHATDGDQVENAYDQRLTELFSQDWLKGRLVNFRRDLKLGQVRGKILILSRDSYADVPVTGGIFRNWTGELDWSKQVGVRIQGPDNTMNVCVVQDYAETHAEGALAAKVAAVEQLLEFARTRIGTSASSLRWVLNFASAYSKVEFIGNISLSDGYRDNAVSTHAAILQHLRTKTPGPTGIILMDFAGVDRSGDYDVRGKELVYALIQNNIDYFEYLTSISDVMSADKPSSDPCYDLQGRPSEKPVRGFNIVGGKKVILK